jgi:hypothetical protein|tara:strand:+ start:329 stop:763 length:435 start_codon:yes stop_codon:yes gene_type:complete
MRLRFRAKNPNYEPINMVTTNSSEVEVIETEEVTPVIETTVTTPTTIIPLGVNVPSGPRNNWGNDFTTTGVDGFVCANAPYPIGTGIGCYRSINGLYTNTNQTSPSFGQTYVLPCIPYFAGGSCFEFENQSTGSPSCNSFCAQS